MKRRRMSLTFRLVCRPLNLPRPLPLINTDITSGQCQPRSSPNTRPPFPLQQQENSLINQNTSLNDSIYKGAPSTPFTTIPNTSKQYNNMTQHHPTQQFPHNIPNAPSEVHQSQSQIPYATQSVTKTTLLITDSLMRHIEDDDLGTNHNIIKINKTCMSQLTNNSLQKQIISICPDFIYIHLGINDLSQNSRPLYITNCLKSFLSSIKILQNTKIIISLPLATGYHYQLESIHDLRKSITNLLKDIKTNYPQETDRLYVNCNWNFFSKFNRTLQDTSNFKNDQGDPIHLSNKGKRVIRGNLRYVIHDLSRSSNSNHLTTTT